MPLTKEQERALAESAKLATASSKLMDQIIEILMAANGPDFDMHLFLLLQHIGREAMNDPQVKDYVAQLDINELPRFRNTVLNYYEFQSEFVRRSLRGVYKSIDGLYDVADKFVEHNKMLDDSAFKMPEIQSAKKDIWAKLHEKLARGRKLRIKP